MIPVIVVRPAPGGERTAAAARAAGLDARTFPLFTVRPLAWDPPPAIGIDALLIGSANALRHAGDQLARYRDKPAYVVGERTGEAARNAGLTVAATGTGGLQHVLDAIALPIPGRTADGPLRLLRLTGAARVPLVVPAAAALIERVVYTSDAVPLPPALAALMAHPCLVLLHSAEAARHFAAECTRLAIDRTRIAIATLGPRITAAAGDGWRGVADAARPDDAALLALARMMCEERMP